MKHWLPICLLALCGGAAAHAADEALPKLGPETTSQWRFGAVVSARGGAVSGLTAAIPVPMDWPEQTVKIVREEKSPHVRRISYRTLDGGVKQMLVAIPKLSAGQEASAIVTFEITKREILEPESKDEFVLPARLPRELQKFLLPSPYIESNDPKIVQLAPRAAQGKGQAWQKSLAIFDFVRDNVEYEFSEQIKPALDALRDKKGDCEELTSLFIAFCRANKIPARAVWVPGHCYPEFYLQDSQGRGGWIPCQVAGAGHDFGRMKEDRPILQKGDNFKVPGEKEPQRYVKQTVTAAHIEAPPEVKFILEPVRQEDRR
jgi:transglutaminase-like putative cysteine protease